MRGLIDFTGELTGQQDLIYQYGPALEDDLEAFVLPDDYHHALYDYLPQVPGIYDPNGFYLKPTENEI
jgi:hypothetical protein